jgi:diguanylate cyclase (GGDEF)-like protein
MSVNVFAIHPPVQDSAVTTLRPAASKFLPTRAANRRNWVSGAFMVDANLTDFAGTRAMTRRRDRHCVTHARTAGRRARIALKRRPADAVNLIIGSARNGSHARPPRLDHEAHTRRERQGILDFTNRVKLGTYLHVAVWVLVSNWIGLPVTAPVFFWINTGLFLCVAAVRYAYYRRIAAELDRDLETCRIKSQVLVMIPAVHWSLLAVLAMHGGPLHPIWMPMLFTVTGLATAGTIILSIDRTVSRWYPIVVIVPTIVAILAEPIEHNGLLAIMCTILLLYTFSVTKLVHLDYWAAVKSRALLEQRAVSLESLCVTDTLTQIPNRLHFDQRLDQAWESAIQSNLPVSVLLVDLDHFKSINDTYGHAYGDECLKAAAQVLCRSMHRNTDLVARWGGEEFAVLLPGAEAASARVIAERLLRGIAGTIVSSRGNSVRLACSIGVATVHRTKASLLSDFLTEVDEALYAAKQQGRNRVVVAAAA